MAVKPLSLSLLLVACTLACTPKPTEVPKGIKSVDSLASMCGRVFHSKPVVLRLGQGWTPGTAGRGWSLRLPCQLVVDVTEQLDTDLAIEFEFDSGEGIGPLIARWNGELLPASAVVAEAGRTTASIPMEFAAPGIHDLILEPEVAEPQRSQRSWRADVTRVSLTNDTETFDLDPVRLADDQFLLRFLNLGVVPGVAKKLASGGFIFDGPGTIRCMIDPTQAGQLHVTASNRSAAEATFWIEHQFERVSVNVASQQQADLSISMEPDDKGVVYGVHGVGDGLFVWEHPRIAGDRPPELPPIIIITIDTTRRDFVPPYTERSELAPHIAEFANHATVFDSAFSTAPWTLPSHASLFTGLYPSRHGAGIGDNTLDRRFTTLAEHLTLAGYATGGFAGGPLCAANRGLAQGFMTYRDPVRNETKADTMTENALAWLAKLGGQAPFLFLNYFDPHYPYSAPPSFKDQVFGADRASDGPLTIGDLNTALTAHGVLPPKLQQRLFSDYETEVLFLDHHIGRVLDALKELDLYESAFIAIVADHGEMLGEKGHLFHSYRLDPELIHIPYLVKWPYQTLPARHDVPVSLVDLYPTVLQVAGIDTTESDGTILPRTQADATAARSHVLSEEHRQADLNPLAPQQKKIADDLWAVATAESLTIVWNGGAQCFEIDGKLQWRDVPCQAEQEQASRQAISVLSATGSSSVSIPASLSNEERQQLQALGYLP